MTMAPACACNPNSTVKGVHEANNTINGFVKSNPNGVVKDNNKSSSQSVKKDDQSYNHLYRKKTKWELSRLSFTMMGAEIVYSLESALILPLLLMYGMQREHVVLMWALPPILGLLFSPLLGTLSDHCHLSLGRRRPFIILLAALDVLGLILVANGYMVGQFFGDSNIDIFKYSNKSTIMFNEINEFTNNMASTSNSNDYLYTIICIMMGTILVDFSTDALLHPSRAYVLDVCITDDYNKGLNISTILAGVGGFIGYIIGSINWDDTFLCEFVVFMLLTPVSFRIAVNLMTMDLYLDNVSGGYGHIVFNIVIVLFVICILATITSFREMPLIKSSSKSSSETSEISINMKNSTNKFTLYVKSIVSMPTCLKIICVTNLLCWMSHLNYYFYFTHFVGRDVYEGDPTAFPGSLKYQLYEEGIRFACLALSINCIASILYPLVSNRLIKKLGIKPVYMGTILFDVACMCLMMVYKTKLMVVILSAVSGIVYCTSFTIPYILVAHYHSSDMLTSKSKLEMPARGLGTDISIIGTCVCMAQLMNSMYMSKFMELFGVTFAVIGTSALLGSIAFITASQISI